MDGWRYVFFNIRINHSHILLVAEFFALFLPLVEYQRPASLLPPQFHANDFHFDYSF